MAAAAATAAAPTTTASSHLLRRAAAAPTPNHYQLRCSDKPSPLALRHSAARPAPAQALPDRVTPFNYDGYGYGDDHPREECGVFGVVGDPEAASLCYLGLQKLQHRGEEGAGIAAAGDDGNIKSVRGLGLVGDVFGDPARLAELPGHAAIGHVRYSTAGANSLRNVQPFLAGYRFGQLAVAHNGNLVNYQELRNKLEAQGSIFNTSSDTEVIQHLIATSLSRPLLSRICDACERLAGAYSLLFLTADKLFAVRDPFGFRPLVMGRRPNGAVVFASETCALDLIDAVYEREVEPGEVVVVDRRDMSVSSACLVPHRPRKSCVFEHIYFSLPNSVVFGHAVHERRNAFGRALAEESPAPTADVVIPVPDSGFYAALGFSQASGLEFQQGLIRWHYSGRSFIQPSQAIRDLAVKLKLAPVRGVITGKSVVVVDDSLVRGTTSSKIVRLLGARARRRPDPSWGRTARGSRGGGERWRRHGVGDASEDRAQGAGAGCVGAVLQPVAVGARSRPEESHGGGAEEIHQGREEWRRRNGSLDRDEWGRRPRWRVHVRVNLPRLRSRLI